jgi:solute carrier family 25 phosphate transporter 3
MFEAKAQKYQTTGFLISYTFAEDITDVLLCPMERLKVRIQTSKEETITTAFTAGFNELKKEGVNGFYKCLVPLMVKQVLYTMVKFGAFENTVRAFYMNVFTKPKH